MGSFSDYLENKVLDKLFNRTDFNATDDFTIWVALCPSGQALTDAGDYTEPAAASYKRIDCSVNHWSAAASGAITNDMTIEFTTAAQSWCTIYGFAVFDASATGAGNMLFCATLTTARDVTVNDQAKFAPGELDVALD